MAGGPPKATLYKDKIDSIKSYRDRKVAALLDFLLNKLGTSFESVAEFTSLLKELTATDKSQGETEEGFQFDDLYSTSLVKSELLTRTMCESIDNAYIRSLDPEQNKDPMAHRNAVLESCYKRGPMDQAHAQNILAALPNIRIEGRTFDILVVGDANLLRKDGTLRDETEILNKVELLRLRSADEL